MESILPRQTCPNIDSVIKGILSAVKEAERMKRRFEGDSDEYSSFDHITYCLYGLDDIMEKLRSANADLRNIAENYIEKCQELESKLSEIESTQ